MDKEIRYIVYEITTTINNMIYVGVHKQIGVDDDDYLGSGTRLGNAKKLYGEDKFKRRTIFSFDNQYSAYIAEGMIVDKDFINREDTYNIRLGGKGGWDHCHNEDVRNKIRFILEGRYGKMMGQCHTPEVRGKGNKTKIEKYGSICGQMHTLESIENRKITNLLRYGKVEGNLTNVESRKKSLENSLKTRIERYGCPAGHLHTEENRSKSKLTHIERYGVDCILRNKDIKEKSLSTRMERYGNSFSHGNSKDFYDKRKENTINKSFIKYPELNLLCKLISPEGTIVKEGRAYDISLFIYGESSAVSQRRKIIDKINKGGGKFPKGPYKGYLVE